MGPWSVYLTGVTVAAAALSVLADRLRTPGAPAVSHPLLIAVLGALMWPVLVVGAVQVGLWVAAQRVLSPGPRRRSVRSDSAEEVTQWGVRSV